MRTKDEQIVFQNQSHLVVKHFTDCGICPTLFDICLTTDLMVEFATKGYSKELKLRFDAMEIYIDEQYWGDKEIKSITFVPPKK